jgi:hypothetical protein
MSLQESAIAPETDKISPERYLTLNIPTNLQLKVTREQFWELAVANRDLRLEQTEKAG